MPRLRNSLLVVESRKYLGVAYLHVERRADAEQQFELLLRAEPEYVLDTLAFTRDVVEVFEAVRTRVREARDAELRAQREREARELAEAQRRERERLAALRRGEVEVTVEENSRALALIPFGVGQFQNGHDGLGYVIAVSSGVLFATAIVTHLLHDSLRDEMPVEAVLDQARSLEQGFRYTNIAANIALAVVAVLGVIDAQARFVPSRVVRRRRLSPPAVSVSPAGVTIQF